MKLLSGIILFIFILSGCSDQNIQSTPSEKAKETQEIIIEAFVDENASAVKSILSAYNSQNNDIDSEIESAFEFIDGKIESYDPPEYGASAAVTDENGRVKYSYYGCTDNIITENGTIYSINFKGWYTYRDDNSKEGVNLIHIVNETEKSHFTESVDWKQCSFDIGEDLR
ncbi:protein of unknown function [Ruminococcus sp. YE71]|uniref:DUF5104 domain-containing protein n=1 Tax=unclassified Ruminococcus TaxID=2608920 RepID=UPI0008809969|nr:MULTISPECIES: DUF5104 domain-containing protein [unclassified Ruminococcus]SDA32694.1 protein of unknown function [Ruminococcus sp. YE78]SFW53615.1 protein of unknown function [Ruminococcus sp. YE71]